MYSGEEIEMDGHLSDFDVSANAMHTLVSDSVELKREGQEDQNYVRNDHCTNNKKTLLAVEKDEEKHKSNDNEPCMSSLALIEDSIEPHLVSNENKMIPILHNRFHSNLTSTNDASFEELMMTRSTIPQSPHMLNPQKFYAEMGPSRLAANHDLYWYSDPPPPPPPFPSG
jgi:hypothetical protein